MKIYALVETRIRFIDGVEKFYFNPNADVRLFSEMSKAQAEFNEIVTFYENAGESVTKNDGFATIKLGSGVNVMLDICTYKISFKDCLKLLLQ